MGIYIKGLTEEEFKSVSWECTYKALKRQGRIIEVKEPHGRLIDESKIRQATAWRGGYDNTVCGRDVETDAPTVIEAEKE